MTGAFLALSLFCVTPSPPDPWFGPDKAKHFFTSAFVQSFAYSGLRASGLGHGLALGGAASVVVTVGVGKEFRDARGGGRFSVRDLAWNAAGAGAAALVLGRIRR